MWFLRIDSNQLWGVDVSDLLVVSGRKEQQSGKLDVGGLSYNSESKIVIDTERWSFGRTDRICIDGNHDVELGRGAQTLVFFEQGENVHGRATLDGKYIYRRGALPNKVDVLPRDSLYISTYIGPPLRLALIEFSDDLVSLMPSRQGLFNVVTRFCINDKFLSLACKQFLRDSTPLVKETLALAILSYTSVVSVEGRMSEQLPSNLRNLVVEYIDENLATEIKISDLARMTQISIFHFIRIFKGTFNLTPYQYIIQRRLLRAEVLLVHTRQSMMEVALSCGFNGASQFSYSFKRNIGLSPAEYRRAKSIAQ
jgi:AraC family transcriptional regulator